MKPVDVYRAFDECEYTYMTHAVGLERTFAELGRNFVKAVGRAFATRPGE